MADQDRCPRCGARFPAEGVLEGICPQCLLEAGMDAPVKPGESTRRQAGEGGGGGGGREMTPSDPSSELLFAILALQMNFITREQIVECGALWVADRSRKLPDLLAEKGYVLPAEKTALEATVKAQVGQSGDPGRSLAGLNIDNAAKQSLLELPIDGELRQTLLELKSEPRSEAVETVVLTKADVERYRKGQELGKGGLGRVLLATDLILNREVAIKEMLKGKRSALMLKRFLHEGEIAGRLAHPNIIPVHDIGVTEEPGIGGLGTQVPYFVMTRIVGRDLKEILRAIENGEVKTSKAFSRIHLLHIFQEVCLAMAYAHDNGVVHRDLKPANIMVGKYGEVYVIDWGLAKILGSKDDPSATLAALKREMGEGDVESPGLTTEGEILGTPAYMPPEQADGQIAEINQRSDIYSLGAMLYEILTFRPPFEGATGLQVIAGVLTGRVKPPSFRADEVRRDIAAMREGEVLRPESVPPDLDEICIKAMAREKGDRFGSAMEIHHEVQLFIEGVGERERDQAEVDILIRKGHEQTKRLQSLRAELERTFEEKRDLFRKAGEWPTDIEKIRPIWKKGDEENAIAHDTVQTFGKATNSFLEALGYDRENREARAALADLYWDQYKRKERTEDKPLMAYFEGLVRQFNDGQYDELLKGDGHLSIETNRYGCFCLLEGREVLPQELNVMEYHPLSGRLLGSDIPLNEAHPGVPDMPVRLRVHGPECTREEVQGADIWLFEYVERDRILYPTFPENVNFEGAERSPVPSEILDACYSVDSPYRPSEGMYLGKTPVPRFRIPMGSYFVIIHDEGYQPVRFPVHVGRAEDEAINVTLYSSREIPDGFVYVPGGKFIYQGNIENKANFSKYTKVTQDTFLARFLVNCQEYAGFLNHLARKSRKDAWTRIPRESEGAGFYWTEDEEGLIHAPTSECLSDSTPGARGKGKRLLECQADWEPDWPILGVSWDDAMTYCDYARKDGWLISLPEAIHAEHAASGADGRTYCWGNFVEEEYCSMEYSHGRSPKPSAPGSFRVDESPFGVMDMSGNAREYLLNFIGPLEKQWRLRRGGAWSLGFFETRVSFLWASPEAWVDETSGFRICCYPRIPLSEKDA